MNNHRYQKEMLRALEGKFVEQIRFYYNEIDKLIKNKVDSSNIELYYVLMDNKKALEETRMSFKKVLKKDIDEEKFNEYIQKQIEFISICYTRYIKKVEKEVIVDES